MASAPESSNDPSHRARCGWIPAGIATIYVVVSLIYIVTSDRIVASIAGSAAEGATFQTVKGFGFVLITGAMLWLLIWRYAKSLVSLNSKLAEGEELHRRLFQDAPIAFVLVRAGKIEAVNTRARALLGEEPDLLGRELTSLAPGDSGALLTAAIAAPPGQRPSELTIVGREGRELIVEIDTTAARDGMTQVGITDVTDRRRMERVLRQAQKMEAIGSLAARMTHEFNNVLTAVLGHAAMAKLALAADDDAHRLISRIESVGQHAAGLTRSMLSLYHQAPTIRRPVEIAGLLEDAAELIRGVLSSAIRLEVDTQDVRGVYCNCDPAPAKQALLNLAVNARDAMPQGGVLSIHAHRQDSRAVIEVRDTGVGITPQVLPHIFTPLFTTKPPDKGTGLGLAVTKGIIEEDGGTIDVYSEPGKGTTFTITVPTCAPAEPSLRAAATAPDGQLLILGEDNPSVRGVLAEALRLAGYCVVTTNDGPSALDSVRLNAASVAAVILDIGLPGMSGLDCLEEIRRFNPTLPCILMTGGDEPPLAPELRERTAFLGKPFSGAELIDTLHALLPRAGSAAVTRF